MPQMVSTRSAHISIHALREEGDQAPTAMHCRWKISIHALREEGDNAVSAPLLTLVDFYPRPPRGGRLSSMARILRMLLFLSTPSARRATVEAIKDVFELVISIHALREEGDEAKATAKAA